MKKLLTTAALAASLAFSGAALAQDDDGTVRLENVTIVEVLYISFKPGKRTAAMDIIDEYFIPATAAAGTAGPSHVVHFDSGKWDLVLEWTLEGGFDDLMWYVSPDDLKWFAALDEIAGGDGAGQAIWDEYISYVANAHTEVAHIHNPEEDGM